MLAASRSTRVLGASIARHSMARSAPEAQVLLLSSVPGSSWPSQLDGATRSYSRTTQTPKIYKIGGDDMTDEQIEKLMEEENAKIEAEEERKKYLDWKPGQRKRPLEFSYDEEEFERAVNPEKFVDDPLWTLRDKRCGGLAIKVGMMPVWDEWAVQHTCTVLWMDRNIVLGHKTMEKHGYSAIQVAAGERRLKRVNKVTRGQYEHIDELKETPPYLVREFRISDEEFFIPVESQIHARHFVPGQNIDVSGISKGKGFQGAMKRHGFSGMPASHGTSLSHRSLGSTGQCQDPGKVFKGKKMAGRMGSDRVTVQNLRIVKIDRGRNLLYVSGAVPGQNGGFIEIRDAVKKPLWRTDEVVGSLKRPPLPTFEYDADIDGSGEKGHEEFMPIGKEDPLDPDYKETMLALRISE